MFTRRTAIAAVATLSVTTGAAANTLSTAESTAADPDIAALFEQVRAAWALARESRITATEEDRSIEACEALAIRLCQTPTWTAAGLAMKVQALALLSEGCVSIKMDPGTWSGAMLAGIMVDAAAITGTPGSEDLDLA